MSKKSLIYVSANPRKMSQKLKGDPCTVQPNVATSSLILMTSNTYVHVFATDSSLAKIGKKPALCQIHRKGSGILLVNIPAVSQRTNPTFSLLIVLCLGPHVLAPIQSWVILLQVEDRFVFQGPNCQRSARHLPRRLLAGCWRLRNLYF